MSGTDPGECRGDACSCDDSGGCRCKSLAEGKKCGSCVPGTFALAQENPEGCIRCFCFGRTNSCHQADYVRSHLNAAKRKATITRGNTPLDMSHGLLVIPGDKGDEAIGVARDFSPPLYWSLPSSFLGDKVSAFNGYLRFSTRSNGLSDAADHSQWPLVQLQSKQMVLEHHTSKLSNSGRYEIRLHPSLWRWKNDGGVLQRPDLMAALQNIDRILIRATDLAGSTEVVLEGVSIDTAVPREGEGDRRSLAIGVEMCQCPRAYASASCQNPGEGYYRWPFTGEAKRCECNGLTDKCDPETGDCIGCRDNTSGTACDKCAPGFYASSRKCLPCQCPSEDQNHAATCSLDARSLQFSCHCKAGYVGPKCDRCDYGYFGNSKVGCQPCKCHYLGSLGDECDPDSGQCSCIPGVTGRDCSQCGPRQVLAQGGRCKNCRNPCIDPVLDAMSAIKRRFDEAEVSDIDPNPGLRINKLEQKRALFEERAATNKEHKGELHLGHTIISTLRPRSELTALEARKLNKAALMQTKESGDVMSQCNEVGHQASNLLLEANAILAHLQDYGLGSQSGHVSIHRALLEARDILATIKRRNYGEADIKTRTELSYARQSLNAVKDIVYGQTKVLSQRQTLDKVEANANDILQFVNKAMEQTREAMTANSKHHDLLVGAQRNCQASKDLAEGSQVRLKEAFGSLRAAGKEGNQAADATFTSLAQVFRDLMHSGGDLAGSQVGLAAVEEDYRNRLVKPCLNHAETLSLASERLTSIFGRDLGKGAEQTLSAANAYQKIMNAILEAKMTAEKGLALAFNVMTKVKQKNEDGYDLFAQADVGRVKSRDLRQDAEGLQQNARQMQIQLEELILRCQTYILTINRRKEELGEVNRNLESLQIVSVLAKEAVRQSHESLRDSEDSLEKVMRLYESITQGLRQKIKEMQSFSPEELGNIPRKCKQALFHSNIR